VESARRGDLHLRTRTGRRFLVATERDNARECQSRLRRILGGQMVVNMVVNVVVNVVVKPFATLTVLLL
jgi:hypothetical protein